MSGCIGLTLMIEITAIARVLGEDEAVEFITRRKKTEAIKTIEQITHTALSD